MKRLILFLICIFSVGCSSNNEQSAFSSGSVFDIYQYYDVKEGHTYHLSSCSYTSTPFDENKNVVNSSSLLLINPNNAFLAFDNNSMTISVFESSRITDEEIVAYYGSKEAFEQEIANDEYRSYDNNTITYSGIIECQYDHSIDTFVSTLCKGYYPYCMYNSISSGSFKLHFKLKAESASIVVSSTTYMIQENSRYYLVGSDPLFYHSMEEIPEEHLHDTDSTIISSRKMEVYEFVFSK